MNNQIGLDDMLLYELAKLVGKTTPDRYSREFNVIEQLHLNINENSHTRILVELLRIDGIRVSFLRYVRNMMELKWQNILSDSAIDSTTSAEVGIFSQYVDAQIVHQGLGTQGQEGYAIIIENKIKGAADQHRQIERYVETISTTYSIDRQRIIVIYLTLDGGKEVSRESFSDEERNRIGAFVPMNYKKHIIDWLTNRLCFSISEFASEPYLSSGIIQYLHYLQMKLKERPRNSKSLEEKICDVLSHDSGFKNVNPYLALSRVRHELGRLVASENVAWDSVWKCEFSKSVVQAHLRGEFYSCFDMVDADDDWQGPYVECDNFALCMTNTLEGQPSSLVYVDFFYENGDANAYMERLGEFEEKLRGIGYEKALIWTNLEYNEQKYTRCYVNNIEQLRSIIVCLSEMTELCKRQANGRIIESTLTSDMENLAKLEKGIELYIQQLSPDDVARFRDGENRNPHYAYRNGWAWQRASWDAYGDAELQVWPRMHGDGYKLLEYLQTLSSIRPFRKLWWRGVVLFSFPFKNLDYEKDLIRDLAKWELDGKQVLAGIDYALGEKQQPS